MAGLRARSRVSDAVPDVCDRLEWWRFAQFASQPADGDVDGVGERIGAVVPYLGVEVLGAEHGALGSQ